MGQGADRNSHYIDYLKGKKIGILGYSDQCTDEAIQLIQNGIEVIIGLRPVDDQWKKAEEAGFDVRSLEDTVEECEIIQVW